MTDTLIAPIWLGITLLLLYAARVVARRMFANDSFSSRLMHALVLSWATIVGVATLLGTIGWLEPAILLVGVAASAGVVLWYCGHHQRALKEGLSRLTPCSVPTSYVRPSHEALVLSITFGFWGLALAWALSRVILKGLLRFPVEWDTLNYHLPLIVQWLHQGSLYVPADANWSSPGNDELIGLWLVAPFSGDFLYSLLNLPAAMLLAVSAMELSRNLGMIRPWDYLTAAALLATGPILTQLTDAQNDIAVVALFMALLAYATRYIQTESRANLVLAAISLGLLTGVKFYAVGYALVAGLGSVILVMATCGTRRAICYCLALTLGACLWGGYWYARNFLAAGSPIYPQGLTEARDKLGDLRSSAGQTPVWKTTLLGNGRPEVFPLLERALWNWTGPCHVAAFFSLPVALIWLSGSGVWLRRRVREATAPEAALAGAQTRSLATSATGCIYPSIPLRYAGAIRFALVFWTISAGLVWGVTPFGVEVTAGSLDSLRRGYLPVRFGLCFLSLCVVCLALVCHDVAHFASRRRSAYVSVLPLAIAVVPVIYQITLRLETEAVTPLLDSLFLTADIWLAGLIVLLVWHTWPRWRRVLTVGLGVTAVVAASIIIGLLGEGWHAIFAKNYDADQAKTLFSDLEKMAPSATRICAMTYRYYPFFGSRRQFYACRPYWLPTLRDMLEYLREHDITLIVATLEDPLGVARYAGKSDWLRKHPDLFPKVYDGPRYYVCRVNSELLKAALYSR
jgi:hypothetical protein